jgi:TRAP-type C4-dicarboxylate transport system permease large subunit
VKIEVVVGVGDIEPFRQSIDLGAAILQDQVLDGVSSLRYQQFSIGLITPPVGNALFLGSIISGVKVERVVRTLMPLYGVMLLVLMLVTFVPQISMFIPSLMR